MVNTAKSILLSIISDTTLGIGFIGTAVTNCLHQHHEHPHVTESINVNEWASILTAMGTFIYLMAKTYEKLKEK